MDQRPYDLWAEVPSPIKTRLRNAFTAYAEECFQKDGILLKTYVPAQVGGNMPKEEYLKGMKPEDLPDACFLMDLGSHLCRPGRKGLRKAGDPCLVPRGDGGGYKTSGGAKDT